MQHSARYIRAVECWRLDEDWRAFFAVTDCEWDGLARWLLTRWRVPSGIDYEDVAQEMRLAIVARVDLWDPELSPLDDFLKFAAVDQAKKWIHSQRQAKRGHGTSPSRHPVLGTLSSLEGVGTYEADQDESAAISELFTTAADQATSEIMREMFLALSATSGDVEEVISTMYSDSNVRLVMRWDSREDARSRANQTIRNVWAQQPRG